AEDRAIEQALHAHGGVGDEVARAQHLDHRRHDARGSRKEPGVAEAEAGTKLPQKEKGERRDDVQQPIPRARGHFRSRLARRRTGPIRALALDLLPSSGWRAGGAAPRGLDQIWAIGSPYRGVLCSSTMLRGLPSGTVPAVSPFPGCAVMTIMRARRHTASST